MVRHFSSLTGHQNGDLISRSQVEPLIKQLEILGWPVPDRAAILNSTLEDSHYVVSQFRTPRGMEFFRKAGSYPLAFDRLDQISRMPGGKLMIQDMLRFSNSELTFAPDNKLDSAKFARFTPRGARNTPTAEDLNRPTGRIY
ncbi:MAG: hypothetical protein KDA41_00235, partial [Planctomycetales bacterium]|nr:hypothetical protein [Planctomycetales bacterium]